MPIVRSVPSAPPEQKETPVQITKPEFKGTVVDTTYTPQSSLMVYVEGSRWIVEYFSQVVDKDNAIQGQSLSRNSALQSYQLIRKMKLKVSTPLSSSQDLEQKTMSVTGNAVLPPFVIPNEGDMFLADVGDGREGVFQVTSSERRSLFKDTVYLIEYLLVDYATDQRRGDLLSKTVKTVVYNDDFLLHGQNPLVSETTYNDLSVLSERYHEVLDHYLRMFSSNEFKTIIVPNQEYPVYDPFLMKAIQSIFTTNDHYLVLENRVLNCDQDEAFKTPTIWEALIKRDPKLLKYVTKEAGLVSTRLFSREALFEGIYYSGIKFVVYPYKPELPSDSQYKKPVKALSDTPLASTMTLEDTSLSNPPLIKPVALDRFYVLSEAFYNGNDLNLSLLEIQVRNYLNQKEIDNRILLQMCDEYLGWGGLEKFYYLPILLILIKASVRNY